MHEDDAGRIEPPEYSLVAGAKGCTPESYEFRDLDPDYAAIGVRIYGLSSQDTGYKREAVCRMHLPYQLRGFPVRSGDGHPDGSRTLLKPIADDRNP